MGASVARMQWKSRDELYREKWESFINFNIGRWKGRSMHISPITGEYIKPYSTEHVVDVMKLVEGAQVCALSQPPLHP